MPRGSHCRESEEVISGSNTLRDAERLNDCWEDGEQFSILDATEE